MRSVRCLATGEAESRAARSRQPQVIGPVACDIGGDVNTGPGITANASGRSDHAPNRRSIVIGDGRLRPGVVRYAARLIARGHGTIGIHPQGRAGHCAG